MPVAMPYGTKVVNDTQFLLAFWLGKQKQAELDPGNAKLIGTFDIIVIRERGIPLRQNPDTMVVIGAQEPNSISLQGEEVFNITFSYRVSAAENRTIRFLSQ